MGNVAQVDPLLESLEAPAAWCDSRGDLVAWNSAFETWAGPVHGVRVEVDGGRAVLLQDPQPPRPVVAVPAAHGGWLVLGAASELWEPLAAVIQVVSRRMDRTASTIEANAAAGLLEQPGEEVAHCLRETLAAAQELRALEQQVAAMGGPPQALRAAVDLRALLKEAIPAMPEGTRVSLEGGEADVTVEGDRGRLFAHLVRLMGFLASRANWLKVGLRAGDPVRLTLTIPPPSWALDTHPLLGETRRHLSAMNGRMLVDAGGSVTVELPSYGRASPVSQTGGGRTVLVADDDESTLAMMSTVMRKAGFRVIAAQNGVAASVLLHQHAQELAAIVADAVLPGRSGIELAAEAAAYEPRIPVLLVSGHPSDLLGADPGTPLLSKPFGARVLAEEVRRLVEAEG